MLEVDGCKDRAFAKVVIDLQKLPAPEGIVFLRLLRLKAQGK